MSTAPGKSRFTVDGGPELERALAAICRQVLEGVQSLVPVDKLAALVLGGGYGRGQGGVLRENGRELPYNDLEFYVFVRGNILVEERRYRGLLNELGERLSSVAGLHVEFKVYSTAKLKRGPVTMFSYDLAAGHKIIFGDEDVFKHYPTHLDATNIPASEATRLLFNRCSGLLLAKDLLRGDELTGEQADFIGRNIAKAQMAFGDAVLTMAGKYHWSCRERRERLANLELAESPNWLGAVRECHERGVEFKLHPRRTFADKPVLVERHRETARLGLQIWLWVENKRLRQAFNSADDYAASTLNKCPETFWLRNWLVNLRTFGLARGFGSVRYPRERLYNALALLLWSERMDFSAKPVGPSENSDSHSNIVGCEMLEFRTIFTPLRQLFPASFRWPDLIQAYRQLWEKFG